MRDEALRRRLLDMAADDQRLRAELHERGELSEGYNPRMEALHISNAHELEAALAMGWPGRSRVGEDGAAAAWLIAQHAISLPAFQRRCLALLAKAVEGDEAPVRQLAYLTDRIRMFEGRPQIYGTQFDWDDQGQMSPVLIEDAAKVDDRRSEAGLPPLAQTIAEHRASAGPAPASLAERRSAYEAWLRKVGWRT